MDAVRTQARDAPRPVDPAAASKHTDRDVLTNEKEHQEEYEDLGLVVVRWGWQHATSRRHVLKVRLERGFERGRARDRAGFPRLWTL